MILVTGATGFLGTELVRQLTATGENVVCLKRAQSKMPVLPDDSRELITWHNADILDNAALEDVFKTGITKVYHCAAMVSFDAAMKKQMIKTNVEGTANIADLCTLYHARLIHVSSIAALGEAKPSELITEENFFEDSAYQNGYAISKHESEMEVWRAIAEGLDAVIVNPSLIIGASAGSVGSGKIFQKIQQGLKFYTIGGCGLVDVEDVAKCMIGLMTSNISGQRFIINAANYSYKQLFSQAAKEFGLPEPQIALKPWLLGAAWRLSALLSLITGKRIGIDRTSATSASKDLFYDNAKIVKTLGFAFKPVNTSIKEICQMLQAHNAN